MIGFAGSLAVALALVGCGTEGASVGDGPTIAKAAYLKRAHASCARDYVRAKVGFQRMTGKAGGASLSTLAEMRRYAKTVLIPSKRRELEELRAIGVPRGDEDIVGEIYEAFEESIEKLEDDPGRVRTASFGVFAKGDLLAEEYGFGDCRSTSYAP